MGPQLSQHLTIKTEKLLSLPQAKSDRNDSSEIKRYKPWFVCRRIHPLPTSQPKLTQACGRLFTLGVSLQEWSEQRDPGFGPRMECTFASRELQESFLEVTTTMSEPHRLPDTVDPHRMTQDCGENPPCILSHSVLPIAPDEKMEHWRSSATQVGLNWDLADPRVRF